MSIITMEHINNGYVMCKTNSYFSSLKKMYSRIPSTECNCCGKCCKENPGGSFVEFLNFFTVFKERKNKKEIVVDAVRKNLTSLAKQSDCIFLQNNKCSIYDVRPVSCRVFGLETKEKFDENYLAVSNGNKQLKDIFKKKFDIDIIDNPKLEYCNNVKIIGERKFNDYDVQQLIIDLTKTESKFHKKGFPLNKTSFDSYESYLTYLVGAELSMPYMAWAELRVLCAKQIIKRGESIALEKFIEKINNYDFEFLK